MLDDLFDSTRDFRITSGLRSSADRANHRVNSIDDKIMAMEKKIELLSLLGQAMFEILRDRVQVSEQEIMEKIEEIDLRDGIKDGKMGNGLLKCNKCNRGYNTKLDKCLYCGNVNEGSGGKPVVTSYKPKIDP